MTQSAVRGAQFSESGSIARRLRSRIAPWIEWQNYQCLTLSWSKAQFARGALTEPPVPVELRRLDRSDLLRLAGDPVYDFSLRFLQRLESRDDLCFAAFASGQLVSYGFFSAAPTDIDEYLRFHFPIRWIYVYKGFTHPGWRGRRLWPFVLLNALPALLEWLGPVNEPAGLVTLVLSDNRSSLKALGRIGFRLESQFPILRMRRRPWLISLPPQEQEDFYIEKIESSNG